nr:hypothetical protein Q903MT_gene3063 [Picea sitchensis]
MVDTRGCYFPAPSPRRVCSLAAHHSLCTLSLSMTEKSKISSSGYLALARLTSLGVFPLFFRARSSREATTG